MKINTVIQQKLQKKRGNLLYCRLWAKTPSVFQNQNFKVRQEVEVEVLTSSQPGL